MKITFENKKALGDIIFDILSITGWEEKMAIVEEEGFWEIDEDDFHEQFPEEELNASNVLNYLEVNPDFVESVYDDIKAEEEFRNWNVNAWRNS